MVTEVSGSAAFYVNLSAWMRRSELLDEEKARSAVIYASEAQKRDCRTAFSPSAYGRFEPFVPLRIRTECDLLRAPAFNWIIAHAFRPLHLNTRVAEITNRSVALLPTAAIGQRESPETGQRFEAQATG